MNWCQSAFVHEHVFVRWRGVKIQAGRFVIRRFDSASHGEHIVSRIVQFEEIKQRLLARDTARLQRRACCFRRRIERRTVSRETPLRERIGDVVLRRSFRLRQRANARCALLQEFMQAHKLRVAGIRPADIARGGFHNRFIDALVGREDVVFA